MTQYQRDFVRMLDGMRVTCKGAISCIGVGADECEKCLLTDICDNEILYNAERVIEIVTQWAKDHPFVTNADKFREVWGHEPKNKDDMYYCPTPFGKSFCEGKPYDTDCEECRKTFWNSEYKEPKKEG